MPSAGRDAAAQEAASTAPAGPYRRYTAAIARLLNNIYCPAITPGLALVLLYLSMNSSSHKCITPCHSMAIMGQPALSPSVGSRFLQHTGCA